VTFAFPGDQKIREAWLGKYTQSGATVTLKNESYNARIEPGGSVMVGFNVTTSTAVNPSPTLITVNGAAC
jgi:endoglucanase